MRLHHLMILITPLLAALPLMGADADPAGPKGAMKLFYQAMVALIAQEGVPRTGEPDPTAHR